MALEWLQDGANKVNGSSALWLGLGVILIADPASLIFLTTLLGVPLRPLQL